MIEVPHSRCRDRVTYHYSEAPGRAGFICAPTLLEAFQHCLKVYEPKRLTYVEGTLRGNRDVKAYKAGDLLVADGPITCRFVVPKLAAVR